MTASGSARWFNPRMSVLSLQQLRSLLWYGFDSLAQELPHAVGATKKNQKCHSRWCSLRGRPCTATTADRAALLPTEALPSPRRKPPQSGPSRGTRRKPGAESPPTPSLRALRAGHGHRASRGVWPPVWVPPLCVPGPASPTACVGGPRPRGARWARHHGLLGAGPPREQERGCQADSRLSSSSGPPSPTGAPHCPRALELGFPHPRLAAQPPEPGPPPCPDRGRAYARDRAQSEKGKAVTTRSPAPPPGGGCQGTELHPLKQRLLLCRNDTFQI